MNSASAPAYHVSLSDCLKLILVMSAICLASLPARTVAANNGTGDLYALIVGLSNYRNPTITQLTVSDKDARDFARFLEVQRGLFRKVNVKLLTNQQATKAEVENNLYYWLRNSGKDDTVLLFFSGHGADDPYFPNKFYFVCHDSDPKNFQGTAINMAGLEFLKPLDSKRIVLIADTCHAGGYSMQGTKRVEPSFERFLSQFRESQGHIIITSCGPHEVSKEDPNRGNSVFTHYLLEGLRGKADTNGDGVVTLKEAYEYVYERVKEATRGIQHPQLEGRFAGKFPLALARLHENPSTENLAPVRRTNAPTRQAPPRTDPGDVETYRRLADQGDVSAQFEIGWMYGTGTGVSQNYTEARKWYHKAAEQGNAIAQYNLGFLYAQGKGGLTDHTEAAKWVRKAAEQGYASAQYGLGVFYEGGNGVGKNYGEAAKWYKKAAEQRHVKARYQLGLAYCDGKGVPKNLSEATRWLRSSAEQGHIPAAYSLGTVLMAFHDQGVPAEYRNYVEAEKWLRKSAESGDAMGQTNLGVALMELGNYDEAFKWFRAAVGKKLCAPEYRLGVLYRDGLGVQKDPREALKWFQEAVKDCPRDKTYRQVLSGMRSVSP